MNLEHLEFHEIANEFPLLGEEETQQLADDIKKTKLQEPLVLYEGQILDGRNRYNALKKIRRKLERKDVVLFEEEYEGQDPVVFVISRNIRRRHLTVGQRAEVAKELSRRLEAAAKQKGEANPASRAAQKLSENSGKTRAEFDARAAEIAHSNVDAVETYRRLEKAAPELAKEVREGRMPLDRAKKEERKKRKPKPGSDDETLAWEKIRSVCEPEFEAMIREDQVPGLKSVDQLVAFANLKDKEMKALMQPLYRGHLSLAHARKFLERTEGMMQVRPDWTWTYQETAVLMKGDEKRLFQRTMNTSRGTLIVALVFANPDKEDVDISVVRKPIKEPKKNEHEQKT